jgi:predicted amidophosphoribosyltransferase
MLYKLIYEYENERIQKYFCILQHENVLYGQMHDMKNRDRQKIEKQLDENKSFELQVNELKLELFSL